MFKTFVKTQKFTRNKSETKFFSQKDYPSFMHFYRRYFMKQSVKTQKGHLRQAKSILDIGCRDGRVNEEIYANYLLRHQREKIQNKRSLGIDINQDLIAIAKKTHKLIPNMEFKVEDAHEMDYKEEFDVATSFFAFQSFKNKQKVLQNMAKAIKPGGKVLVAFHVFSKDPVWVSAQKIAKTDKWKSLLENQKVPIFEEGDEIKEYAKSTGLTVEKCEIVPLRFPFLADYKLLEFIQDHQPFKNLTPEQNVEFSTEIMKDMNCERTIEDNTDRIWYKPSNYYIFIKKRNIYNK